MKKEILIAASLSALLCGCVSTPEPGPTEAKLGVYPNADFSVLCHYMGWFQHEIVDGAEKFDHWEWQGAITHNASDKFPGSNLRDIASTYHPRIGVYDSKDQDVIDYHILSAKAVGIEGFIVDWYGPNHPVDTAFQVLIDRAEKLDFKAALCAEEKTWFPDWYPAKDRAASVARATEHLSYGINTYGHRPGYWKHDGKPCIFLFAGWGNWGDKGRKILTTEEWGQVFESTQPTKWTVVRQGFDIDHKDRMAIMAWCGNEAYTKWYASTGNKKLEDGTIPFFIAGASPGFDSRGTWGWGNGPNFEFNMGLENYARYWDDILESKAAGVQLITWNDFAEGTVIEPTVEYGHLYLDYTEQCVADVAGRKPDLSDNKLAYNWFILKKFSDPRFHPSLDTAQSLLAQGDSARALSLLITVQEQSGVKIPNYIHMDNEYPPPVSTTEKGQEQIRSVRFHSI